MHALLRRRRTKVLLALGALLGVAGVLLLAALGPQLLLGDMDATSELILYRIRLPRALSALLCGAALGLSGTLMQAALRNPLASPFTLGISQSAAFGASAAIVLLGAYTHEAAYLLVAACAFVAAFGAMMGVLMLGHFGAFSPTTLILGGVAIGTLFGAATMLLQYFGSDSEVAATLFWTFGDLGKAIWAHVWMLGSAIAAVGVYGVWRAWQMDALLLGDERAHALGVNPARLRLHLLLGASLLGALAVAFFGVIGFIGLAAPHLVRLVLGASHRALVPLSALCGAVLLLGADLLSRALLSSVVLPVGIMTAFLGAPLFLYLLVRQERSWR